MEWAKFKPEVSGSLLVLVICLMLAIVSISFPYWLTNGIVVTEVEGAENIPLTTVSFGLFEGRKTRTRGGTCTRTVQWVCSTGVCMMSCGATATDRREDIRLVLHSGNTSAPEGDNSLCPPCKNSPQSDSTTAGVSLSLTDQFDPTERMVRHSILVTVIAILLVGLFFTFLSIVMTVLNIVHTPVSSILGIDGLIVWNLVAGLMYLLVMMIWGAEYNLKLRHNVGVSDSLRPADTRLASHSNIGWCCLLLVCPMTLHFSVSFCFAWRQYKRYYNKQTKQNREMRINVQDPSQGGTDILF